MTDDSILVMTGPWGWRTRTSVPVRPRLIPRMIPFLIAFALVCRLSYGQYSGGTGTPEDPYQIARPQDLVGLGDEPNDYDKHFILSADIDLSEYAFIGAVIASDTEPNTSDFQGTGFSGSFDGNGHRISNLTTTGESHPALFGRVESPGKVSNLGVVNVNVISSGGNIGGLVGANYGSVVNCYSSGVITGAWHVGGLVGRSGGGSITTSYSTGVVTGNDHVGGLVGHNDGNIATSYSTGSVTGDRVVGGLVGANVFGGSITTSFSTGSVTGEGDVGGLVGIDDWGGRTSSSFWDIETSGHRTSAGGTGLTTAEMQDIDTFLSVGWDFTTPVWTIDEGMDYPRLSWDAETG